MTDNDTAAAPESAETDEKMGFNATWSMAVGGMIGGGIFSVLGVVLSVAGSWSWLSFVVGGLIALSAADSYVLLANEFGEGGGAFTFLREVDHEGFGGAVSWIVIAGYVLTISVYAFTFGHYVAHVFEVGPWFPRVTAVAVIAVLMGVNLRGVGDASLVEIVAVWGKLLVLVGLGAWGLSTWQPAALTEGITARGPVAALVGAATVFMAYEGFQLLAYDYEEVKHARKIVPLAMFTSIVTVVGVYLVVAFGATMLVGARTMIEHKEVALAIAGRQAAGTAGLWVVTLAAAFSTISAINATLFAVGRLAERVAEDGELPGFFDHENSAAIPDRAIIFIGTLGAVLAAMGSLSQLVEAASLGFLLTFTIVNLLALREVHRRRWISAAGALGGSAAFLVLLAEQIEHQPWTVGVFVVIVLLATVGRSLLLHRRN